MQFRPHFRLVISVNKKQCSFEKLNETRGVNFDRSHIPAFALSGIATPRQASATAMTIERVVRVMVSGGCRDVLDADDSTRVTMRPELPLRMICPGCGGTYRQSLLWGLNFGMSRYERCGHCHKWHWVTMKNLAPLKPK